MNLKLGEEGPKLKMHDVQKTCKVKLFRLQIM